MPAYADSLGYTEVKGKTLKECEDRFNKASKDFRERATAVTKVILYNLSANANVYRDETVIFKSSLGSIFDPDRLSFSIAAAVFMESKTVMPGGKTTFDYKEEKSNIPKSMRARDLLRTRGEISKCRLDWTQQREEFFCMVGIGLENLIMKLVQGLEDPEKVLELADSVGGGNLLMNSKE